MKIKVAITILIICTVMSIMVFINNKKENEKKLLISNENIGKIYKIELIAGTKKYEFKKLNKEWYLEETTPIQVDNDKIKYFMYSLKNIFIDEFITSNESEYKKYGVKKGKIMIIYFDDSKSIKIILGNSNSKIIEEYIRVDEKVFLINRLLNETFDISIKDLYKGISQ